MSLLKVKNLRVTFETETGPVQAVRGVSFSLGHERLGIVGESGSGKSTALSLMLGLARPTTGTVRFHGEPLDPRDRAARRAFRRQVQVVFQYLLA